MPPKERRVPYKEGKAVECLRLGYANYEVGFPLKNGHFLHLYYQGISRSVIETLHQATDLFHCQIRHYNLQRLVHRLGKFCTLHDSKLLEKFKNFCDDDFAPAVMKLESRALSALAKDARSELGEGAQVLSVEEPSPALRLKDDCQNCR